MVTSLAELDGAALVGCCYHIDVEVNSSDDHSSHIHNVEIAGSTPIARLHRPLTSAVDDFCENHFHWNRKNPSKAYKIRLRAKTPWAKQIQHDNDVAAREIREAAQQSGRRVPDKREAQAMARLCEIAERIVGKMICYMDCIGRVSNGTTVHARWYEEFGVHQQMHFKVLCTRSEDGCKAQLFVDAPEKVLATGIGADHFDAMQELEEEVVYRPNERRKLWGRR